MQEEKNYDFNTHAETTRELTTGFQALPKDLKKVLKTYMHCTECKTIDPRIFFQM